MLLLQQLEMQCSALYNLSPSIFRTHLIQFRDAARLEFIPAATGQEARYTLDRLPVHHRATKRETSCTLTHTPRDNLPINLTCMPNMRQQLKRKYPERTCKHMLWGGHEVSFPWPEEFFEEYRTNVSEWFRKAAPCIHLQYTWFM